MAMLKYYVDRSREIMIANTDDINDFFVPKLKWNYNNSIWFKLEEFLGSPAAAIKGDDEEPSIFDKQPVKTVKVVAANDDGDVSEGASVIDDGSDEEASLDELEEETQPELDVVPERLNGSFAGLVLSKWYARQPYFLHSYAIAGWILSPAEPIMKHVAANMRGEHKKVVDSLLKKLLVQKKDTMQAQSFETMRVMTTFWKEHDDFTNKIGIFGDDYIWTDPQRETHPHLWHKCHSYPVTDILGPFACLIVSKILGQGQAERQHGFSKDLKQSKRAKISHRTLMEQVTSYGAYSTERAMAKKRG